MTNWELSITLVHENLAFDQKYLEMKQVWSADGTLECYTLFCRYSDRSPSAGIASISIKKKS